MKYYYADEIDKERCYNKEQLIEQMKWHEVNEVKAYEAKPVRIPGIYYCSLTAEFGEKLDYPCLMYCGYYAPISDKCRRCKFYVPYSYERTEKFIILKLKPPKGTK